MDKRRQLDMFPICLDSSFMGLTYEYYLPLTLSPSFFVCVCVGQVVTQRHTECVEDFPNWINTCHNSNELEFIDDLGQ